MTLRGPARHVADVAGDTSHLEAATSRACAWCGEPIPPGKRLDAKTCRKSCRQALHRFRVAPAGSVASKPMRFGYADPPYPGLARKYYRCPEVDHRELVRRLVVYYPDGFALSTSARALPDVLAILVGYKDSRDIRVCPWVRGSRKGKARRARNAWEALIVVGGRPRHLGVAEDLDDVLIGGGGHQRSHPGSLVGMKPAAFAEWMFRLLGAQVGDELDDLYPGSGAIGRAWRMFTSTAPDVSRRAARRERVPSRLAGATRRMRELARRSR